MIQKQDADVLSLALDPKRIGFVSKIKILNLSRNLLQKEGAKILATIFKTNGILEVLDVSSNKLGVAGAQCLAEALRENKSVKYLNIFANKIDVDGARSFETTLSVNSTLEFIDFGHNRLRDEGTMALARGISKNKDHKLKFLGLRFNFISEDGIIDFLKKVYGEGKKSPLQALYIRNNAINDYGLMNIVKNVTNLNIKLHIDVLDKIKLLDTDILERTVWIHPATGTTDDIKTFFEVTHNVGIVLNVRERRGTKWPNRAKQENKFFFVEFADPTSVTRALHLASRKLASLNGVSFRIYKAGSGTYYYSKQKRPKHAVQSRTNMFRGGRGRGARGARGGFRGRGAPRGVESRGGFRGRGARGTR